MSLGGILNIALSGVLVNKESLAVTSLNIANVNNADYARRVVQQESLVPNNHGAGVGIVEIERLIDYFLVQSIRDQQSLLNYADTLNNYQQRVQNLHGVPGSGNSLEAKMADFFTSLKNLSINPESLGLIRNTVHSTNMLASTISSLAYELHNLRYQADRDLVESFNKINSWLTNLAEANALAQTSGDKLDASYAQLLEDRDNLLRKLAGELNISVLQREDGRVNIVTGNGLSLLDDNQYRFVYNPIPTLDYLLTHPELNPVHIYRVNNLGELDLPFELVTGGIEKEIQTSLTSGTIKALLDLRDNIIPAMIDQLDMAASQISIEFNRLHNTGTGYPGLTTINSTRSMSLEEERNFSGVFRIGAVDQYGRPLKYPPDSQGNRELFYPLDLDLNKLDIGKGPGRVNIQTIIDEINQYFYFSPALGRVALGPLDDIKIAATDDLSTIPDGIFKFDFELTNKSQEDSHFEVLDVQTFDSAGNAVAGTVTTSFPLVYNSLAGTHSRTSQPITVNFAPGLGTGPYTVQAQVRVADSKGDTYNSLIEFIIDDTPPTPPGLAIRNKRFIANRASGQAILYPPVTTQSFARAKLVDKDGNEITATGEKGYLVIESAQENCYLSIDDLSSQELGLPENTVGFFEPAIPATNRGLGHFFGFNNFFEEHTELKGSALKMKVRDAIIENEELLTRGKLTRSSSVTETVIKGSDAASGSLELNGIPSNGDTIEMNGQVFTFRPLASSAAEITIGATLPATMTNIVSALNAVNSYTYRTVDQAAYSLDISNRLLITYKIKGEAGNKFHMKANITAGASLNGSQMTNSSTSNLFGGQNINVVETSQPWSYEMGVGGNQVINDLIALSTKVLDFPAYGKRSRGSFTLHRYITETVSYAASEAAFARENLKHRKSFYEVYVTKFQASAGVNLDKESADTIKFQQAYNASARMVKLSQDLLDVLMNLI